MSDDPTIDDLLSKGAVDGGKRSRQQAQRYLADFRRQLALGQHVHTYDRQLEDFLTEVVQGAAWYQKKLSGVRKKIAFYIALNVALVVALPLGVTLLARIPGVSITNGVVGQLTTVLTGVLGLQKTLSSWYASQQRYAAWYKSGSDLKSIYYAFVQTWEGQVDLDPDAFIKAVEDGVTAARGIIANEQLDFYQKLALPSFDVLDLLTSSGSTVSTLVANLIPSAPQASIAVTGHSALVTSSAAAPGASDGANRSAQPLPPGVHVRHPGATKPNKNPYTIVVIANGALEQGVGTLSFNPDPILTMPGRFEAAVQYVMTSLFGRLPNQAENFLNQFESRIRLISIFDPSLKADASGSLISEDGDSAVLTPRQTACKAFLSRYQDQGAPMSADVVIAITASDTHTRCSSYWTYDDPAGGGIPCRFDNQNWTHCFTNQQPGIVALHVDGDSVTALHEFSHAASSWQNGCVLDLYADMDLNPPPVNLAEGRPVPVGFANYDSKNFATAPNRGGGIPYPDGWQDYHCALVDTRYPALMDDYRLAAGLHSELCRHDQITLRFLTDRIEALCSRP